MNKIFKSNPNLQQYFETSDGVKFFREDHAKSHARSLKVKAVKTVERSLGKKTDESPASTEPEATATASKKAPAAKSEKKLTAMQLAKLRVDAIEEMTTIEEVNQALVDETAKSVLKAGADRIAAIKASEALNAEKANDNIQTK